MSDMTNKICYFLGMAITDGSLRESRNRITFHNNSKDKPLFEYINSFHTPSIYRTETDTRYPNNEYLQVAYILTDEEKRYMKKIGFIDRNKENNTYTLKSLTDEEFLYFFLGMVDGDGTVMVKDNTGAKGHQEKNRIEVGGTLIQLFKEMKKEVERRFNIPCVIEESYRNKPEYKQYTKSGNPIKDYYYLRIKNEHAITFSKLLPFNEIVPDYYKHVYLKMLSEYQYEFPQKKNLLTKEQIDKIFELYEQGYNINQISQIVGCDYTTVMNRIERGNKDVGQKQGSPITEEEVKQMIELRKQGLSYREIERQFKRHHTNIKNRIKKYIEENHLYDLKDIL